MNIVSAPTQTAPAVSVATDVRSPIDETDSLPRNNLIPPLEDAQANAGLGRRTTANEDQANSNRPSDNARGDTARAEETGSGNTQQVQLSEAEQAQLVELSARDREVRAHEAAHANAGGRFAGSASFSYQRGPDGQNYAVGGEVAISTGAIAGDPQATIQKAQIVRRAALAPAQPSSQDRAVAAQAAALELAARNELQLQQAEQRTSTNDSPEPQVNRSTPSGGDDSLSAVSGVSGDSAVSPVATANQPEGLARGSESGNNSDNGNNNSSAVEDADARQANQAAAFSLVAKIAADENQPEQALVDVLI